MDWSLGHCKLQVYKRCSKAEESAPRGHDQISFLTWLSAQATRWSSAKGSIDDIVPIELL